MTNKVADPLFRPKAAQPTLVLPIGLFASLAALNFFRIGYQLVVAAWSSVQITGRADAAGMILLISTLANLICSPMLGAAVDFFRNKKAMLVVGHLGIALAGGIPLLAETLWNGQAKFVAIAAAVVCATVFGIVLGGATDYFLKTHLPQSARSRQLAMLNSTAQIALILGTACGGLIVAKVDSSHAFLVVALCGALLAGVTACLFPALIVARDDVPSLRKRGILSAGPALYFKHRRLFSIACCAALAFSIGQITNTLLPGLVGVHLRGTSVSYSMIEAAWSLGALLVGLWLAKFAARSPGSIRKDYAIVAAMAVVLAAVPILPALPALLTTHFLLGAGFALVRIRSETRFLAECPRHLLGRFRANSVFITSSIGSLIFATPALFGSVSVAGLYLVMAGIVAISSIGLLLLAKTDGRSQP